MRRGTVWVIGAAGVALLWGAAAAHKARPLERQIAATTAAELKRQGLDRRIEALVLRIDGRDLAIGGIALREDDRRQALAIAAATPGIRELSDNLKVAPEARPFVFRAVRNGDGSATVTGVTPSPDAIEKIGDFARTLFGPALHLSLHIARGAPEGDWFTAARLAVELVAVIELGEVELTDRQLRLRGRAPDDAALDTVKAALARSLPAGYAADSELFTALDEELRGGPVTSVKDCQALVDKVTAGHALRFEHGRAALAGTQPRLFDRLALAAKRCGGLYLQIFAASDSGAGADPEENLRLSEARAKLLADALVERGVPRVRLAALGRGRVDPRRLAATPDIEFRVSDSVVPVVRPYQWQIEKGADGNGAITGHHPSTDAQRTLAGLARPALRGRLAEASRLAHGAPPGDWLAAASLAIEAMAKLESGAGSLSDYDLSIRGVAKDDATAAAVEALAERVPQGFRAKFEVVAALDHELAGPPLAAAERCQLLFDSVLRTRAVEFAFDGKALFDHQRQLFQRLAAAARRCPSFTVEIGAHTAGTGDADAAKALSERWAQSVAEAIALAGADRRRLRPVGFGTARPLVNTGSEDDRQRNRRIAVRVIP